MIWLIIYPIPNAEWKAFTVFAHHILTNWIKLQDFTSSTVVTTIATTTASLSEVNYDN